MNINLILGVIAIVWLLFLTSFIVWFYLSLKNILKDSKDKNFQKTGLKLKSAIKTTKIATLDKVVILGKLGELDTQNTQKVKKSLKAYFGL